MISYSIHPRVPVAKADRNAALYKDRLKHPLLTWEEFAQRWNVNQSRAHRIFTREYCRRHGESPPRTGRPRIDATKRGWEKRRKTDNTSRRWKNNEDL